MNFPKNFSWGVSTASYQIEGATHKDGRTPSIWDVFCRTPGKVYAGENGDVATDHYHKYATDIALMKTLGIDTYRLSIAWPRIFPQAGIASHVNGSINGAINPKGIDFYNRIIDCLLEHQIQPALTLYHWDLPYALQQKGGWANRETAYYFQEYAYVIFNAFGDRVKMWMPHNEPWCTTILGYLIGFHAPGIKNKQKAYDAIHHVNLSHGLAVQSFKASKAKGKIGPALNMYTPQPASQSKEDILAADRAKDRDMRMFLNPLFGLSYPQRHLDAVNITLPIQADDMKIIHQPVDFVGINYYSEKTAKFAPNNPEQFTLYETPAPTTDMGWPIVPEGILRNMQAVIDEIGKIDLYITENGSAQNDLLVDKAVHDYGRICYLRDHLAFCAKAIQQGIPLKGYFAWSFIDNFEWTFGYTKRFGLVYCDYQSLKRIPKDSFYEYQKIISQSKR